MIDYEETKEDAIISFKQQIKQLVEDAFDKGYQCGYKTGYQYGYNDHMNENIFIVTTIDDYEARALEMALNDCKTKHNGCDNCTRKCAWRE